MRDSKIASSPAPRIKGVHGCHRRNASRRTIARAPHRLPALAGRDKLEGIVDEYVEEGVFGAEEVVRGPERVPDRQLGRRERWCWIVVKGSMHKAALCELGTARTWNNDSATMVGVIERGSTDTKHDFLIKSSKSFNITFNNIGIIALASKPSQFFHIFTQVGSELVATVEHVTNIRKALVQWYLASRETRFITSRSQPSEERPSHAHNSLSAHTDFHRPPEVLENPPQSGAWWSRPSLSPTLGRKRSSPGEEPETLAKRRALCVMDDRRRWTETVREVWEGKFKCFAAKKLLSLDVYPVRAGRRAMPMKHKEVTPPDLATSSKLTVRGTGFATTRWAMKYFLNVAQCVTRTSQAGQVISGTRFSCRRQRKPQSQSQCSQVFFHVPPLANPNAVNSSPTKITIRIIAKI